MKKNKHDCQGIQVLMILYNLQDCPNKIVFNPTIIKVEDDFVYFGMKKHYGGLCILKSKIIDILN
jgi:hypothetical protein